MTRTRLAAYAATLGLVLSACATRVSVPEIPVLDESIPFKAAKREADEKPPVKIVEVPKPLPLPGQLKPVPEKKDKGKDDKQPKERVAEAHALAKIEPVKDGYVNAIQVYPYTKGALYQLYAAPSQVTDIALEAGEKLVSVSAGDTVRWVVGDTTSGEGKQAQVHILVKPIGADLETNLVIATDRRTYHLEMRSSEKTYMASVSWTYPASELIALKKQRAEADVAGTVIADTGIDTGGTQVEHPGLKGRVAYARDFTGDTSFPPLARHEWRETAREPREGVGADGFAYAFVRYERVAAPLST